MKLVDCLRKVDNPDTWGIRFYEDQPLTRPYIHTITDNLGNLYREWVNAGPNLSGNQKYIYGIMIAAPDGRVFLVDDAEYITFEQLMEKVKAELYSK